MIWRLRYLSIAIIVTAGLTAGCQTPAQPTGPTVERVNAGSDADRDLLWEAACDTLRRSAFKLDREDRANGVITTHSETAAQGFELWRPQPQPAYYWVESNLQTIQRRVTIHIAADPAETDKADEQLVDVKVERFRYRLPERQVDNAAGALRIFSGDAPATSGRSEKPSESSYWIAMGRDEPMEWSLLTKILQRYQGSDAEP